MSMLAALPILTILVLMVGLRWSAAAAGLTGLAVTVVVALVAFEFPASLAISSVTAVQGVAAEAGFMAVTILWILGPALGIHHVQLRSGATETLRQGLGQLSPDPRILALLIAWFFALFMEGAAGFGTSVALAAPFLVGVGFTPVTAVVAAMIGHVVGVSFGALGTPVVPQVAATGISALELSRATGLYHTLLGALPLIAMMMLVVRSSPGRDSHQRSTWWWTATAGFAFLVPFTLLSRYVGPELPTVAGAMFGAAGFVAMVVVVGRRRHYRATAHVAGASVAPRPQPGALVRAAAPYLVMVALVLATRMIAPLSEVLQRVELAWILPGGFEGRMAPLYHPGTMLLAGFLAAAGIQRVRWADVRGAFVDATRALLPVSVALIAVLALARLMVHATMIDALAVAAATAAGGAWPMWAPAVGALGTFVTGSATASNILFTDFQQATAQRLGLSVAPLAGAQGFGAAVGNAICPHNIVAASATVGLTGSESEVLRRTLWLTAVMVVAGGLLALAFAHQ